MGGFVGKFCRAPFSWWGPYLRTPLRRFSNGHIGNAEELLKWHCFWNNWRQRCQCKNKFMSAKITMSAFIRYLTQCILIWCRYVITKEPNCFLYGFLWSSPYYIRRRTYYTVERLRHIFLSLGTCYSALSVPLRSFPASLGTLILMKIPYHGVCFVWGFSDKDFRNINMCIYLFQFIFYPKLWRTTILQWSVCRHLAVLLVLSVAYCTTVAVVLASCIMKYHRLSPTIGK